MTTEIIDRAQKAVSLLPRQPRDSEKEYYWRVSVVRAVIQAMREPPEAVAIAEIERLRAALKRWSNGCAMNGACHDAELWSLNERSEKG